MGRYPEIRTNQDFFWRKPKKINPKEYPKSNDMMGRFLRTGFLWLRHANNSRSFDPRRRLGDKCKAQLAELKQQPFPPKCAGDSETHVQNSVGLQRTFWEAKAICCKKQKTNVSFCPKTFTMAEDPKAIAAAKKRNSPKDHWTLKKIAILRT